jgi:HSP20 family molecular chaperone IbpA
MASKPQSAIEKSVRVVEADVFDRMNETTSLIAQRAFEIYEARGGSHGSDQDDWFMAEGELVPKLPIEYDVTESAVQLTMQVPGFEAKDLEVEVGHQRAIIFGIHIDSNQTDAGNCKGKKMICVADLPFDVDPQSARATLQSGTLEIVLPRLSQANP